MSESVSLPALGESVTEGTVTRWLKQVGDRVEVDEPLLEVSTDKVDTEIPSPVAGVIEEILVAEDETVEVGAPLVRIGDGSGGGSDGAAPAAEESNAAPAAEVPAAGEPSQAPAQPTQDAQEAHPQEATTPQPEAPQPEAPQPEAPQPEAPQPEAPQADPQQPDSQQPEAPQPEPAPVSAEEPAAAEQPEDLGAGTAAAAEVESAEVAEEAPAGRPTPSQSPSESPSAAAEDTSHAGYVTPIVRKLAHEKGVDLAGLTGTGVGGRIRKQDVLDAADRAVVSAPASDAATPEAPTAAPARTAPVVSDLRGTTVPMSRLRKVVAERAVVSMQTSAQLTTVVEVDVTRVARYRDQVKASFQEKTGTKLSFLPFFTLAAAEALKTYPIVNATIDGESIVYPDHENISIAVDTERGLLTPVVRNASALSLADLAKEIADLAARTRDNRLKPDELSGGTFTVTNTGSRGALFDTPLVFLPQVAILGTGIVVKKPAVVDVDGSDAIAIRSTVYLALSYDHRIVDGADAARFLTAVKDRLEAGDFAADLGI